jgi:hypothetical protein
MTEYDYDDGIAHGDVAKKANDARLRGWELMGMYFDPKLGATRLVFRRPRGTQFYPGGPAQPGAKVAKRPWWRVW